LSVAKSFYLLASTLSPMPPTRNQPSKKVPNMP